jgi:hypothetical protein
LRWQRSRLQTWRLPTGRAARKRCRPDDPARRPGWPPWLLPFVVPLPIPTARKLNVSLHLTCLFITSEVGGVNGGERRLEPGQVFRAPGSRRM